MVINIVNLVSILFRALSVAFKTFVALIDEEDPSEKPVMKDTSKLKRSKSAISSKFRVIKKTKRDRATRKTLPTTLTEVCY